MLVLDTNLLSEALRPAPNPSVAAWFESQQKQQLFTTAITRAEILFGVAALPPGSRRDRLRVAVEGMFAEDFGNRILAFNAECAPHFADIAVGRKLMGRPISQLDAMIAAIVRTHGARLVTRNTADFERCGIDVVNPWL